MRCPDEWFPGGRQVSEIVEGPGETLRAARLVQEISCREVADALNLPVRVVEAIEANDFEQLPAAVFARGYVRSYARLLDLDPEPMLIGYPSGEKESESAAVVSSGRRKDLVREHPRLVLLAAGVLLAVILTALGLWMWPPAEESASAEAPLPRAEVSTLSQREQQRHASVLSAENSARPAPSAAGSARPAPAAETVDVARLVSQFTKDPVVNAPAALFVADAGTAESLSVMDFSHAEHGIATTGGDRLRFQFEDDCWVEIDSVTGANLYSDLNRAGRALEFVGEAPFKILLGNAPGVTLSFNNEDVALGPHTRNNVAMLVLGQ